MSNPTHHFNDAPLGQIIDFILPNFHDKHRTQLPELIAMAEKVESRHADSSALMNPLMILVKIIKLRWIHILSYDQMVSPKINNHTTNCANSIFYTTLFTNSAPNYT